MDSHLQVSQIPAAQAKRHAKYFRFKVQLGDERLIPQLTEPHRELLGAQSESYKELAARFGIPVGTVRSRLHRARAALEKLRLEQASAITAESHPLAH